jgi:hypothetical protein
VGPVGGEEVEADAAGGEVTRRDTPSSLYETYVRFCTENNLNVEVSR